MLSEKEIKEILVSPTARKKFEVLKLIYSDEDLCSFSSILIYKNLLKRLKIKDPKTIKYNSLLKWHKSFKLKTEVPSKRTKDVSVQKISVETIKKPAIKLQYSQPSEEIYKPLINIIKNETTK